MAKLGYEFLTAFELKASEQKAIETAVNMAKFQNGYQSLCRRMAKEYLKSISENEEDAKKEFSQFLKDTANGSLLIERVTGETEKMIAFHFEDGKQFTATEFFPYTANMCQRVVYSWCEYRQNVANSLCEKYVNRNKKTLAEIKKLTETLSTVESLGVDTEPIKKRIKALKESMK